MPKHGTKTTLVFSPADGEASWSLLPSSVFLLSGITVQPENIYSCILKVNAKKDKHRHSYHHHLPKPVSTDLTITPDSVLINPIGKDS